jgi:hypothetical protein
MFIHINIHMICYIRRKYMDQYDIWILVCIYHFEEEQGGVDVLILRK